MVVGWLVACGGCVSLCVDTSVGWPVGWLCACSMVVFWLCCSVLIGWLCYCVSGCSLCSFVLLVVCWWVVSNSRV